MNPKVFIALSTFAQQGQDPVRLLEQTGWEFKVNASGKRLSKAEVMGQLQGFTGVVAGLEPYDAEVLKALPSLRCISRCGVGIDNVDAAQAAQSNIVVLNTPGVVVQPVAEMALALIFDLLRKVSAHTALMRQHKWERLTGTQLAGKTVGILGLGRIGRRVAHMLKALDAKVMAFDLKPDEAWALAQGIHLATLDEVLIHSDIVTLHLTHLPQQPFCLQQAHFARMKKGALLINTARGSFIDEQALVEALSSGHLAGAGLDVHAQEPYTGPLCDMPNVVLTPHVATLTHESRLAMEIEAVENLIKFFKGKSHPCN